MLPYRLIDGYNLLHAAGLARAAYGRGDLERARHALLASLAQGLDEAERERTTVVFDAHDPPPDADRSLRFRGMTVLFSADAADADTVIEELIRQHPAPRQLRVVSDDRRLQIAAKRRGCQAIETERFLSRLQRAVVSARPVEPPAAGTATATVGEWLDFFGMETDDLAAGLASPSSTLPMPQMNSASPARRGKPEPQLQPIADTGQRPIERPAVPLPVEDETPTENLAFWQQRINQMLADERGNRDESS